MLQCHLARCLEFRGSKNGRWELEPIPQENQLDQSTTDQPNESVQALILVPERSAESALGC